MIAWLVRLALVRAFRRGGPAITTLSFGGQRLQLDWASSEHVPVREVLIRGEYWPEEAFRPAPGQTVVDVGANAGVYACYAGRQAGRNGRVVAIEPNPNVIPRLLANVRLNDLEPMCTVVPAAVSSRSDRGTLVVGDNSTIGRLAGPGTRGVEVRVRTLDEIIGELAVSHIDLMKIDVEGSEVDVLLGGGESLRRTDRVVIEVGTETSALVTQALTGFGFGRVIERPGGCDSGGWLVFARRDPG
jgi:FkbM family methyltransferase